MYLDMLIHDQPDCVLGLGTYSGVDQDKIRIETICTNQFRNNVINGDTHKKTEINHFLLPTENMKYASAIGNSYCNLVSWKIMQLINQEKLESQYTFLHVPRKIRPWITSPEIDQALLNFLQTQ